jgi:hypothetical protein
LEQAAIRRRPISVTSERGPESSDQGETFSGGAAIGCRPISVTDEKGISSDVTKTFEQKREDSDFSEPTARTERATDNSREDQGRYESISDMTSEE